MSCKSKIEACVTDIDPWMIINKLKMNGDKTEILVFRRPIVLALLWISLILSQRMCFAQLLQGTLLYLDLILKRMVVALLQLPL